MLPVVDTNWNPARLDNAAEFHILRAVAVQPLMSHNDALQDLQALCEHAQTPGLGGLPHGVVVHHEPEHDSHLKLQTMLGNDRVRGISVRLRPDTRHDVESFNACVEALDERGLSIELAGDIDRVVAVSQMLHESRVPLVCNVSQVSVNGKSPEPTIWSDVVLSLASNPFVNIKLSELPMTISAETLSSVIRKLVDSYGVQRLVFGSSDTAPGNGNIVQMDCWQQLKSATQWASASDRDFLFRQNAVRLYQL